LTFALAGDIVAPGERGRYQHISQAPDPVDLLVSWSLPREEWADLVSGVPGAKPHRDLGETRIRLEECASGHVRRRRSARPSKSTGRDGSVTPEERFMRSG